MSRSILCGVDGSEDARLALRAAAQLSAQLDARLVVAHVVQTAIVGPRIAPGAVTLPLGGEREAGELLLDGVLEAEGLEDVERRVVFGFPAERLADLADEEDAELIVVGSRGRGAFRAAFLGSVSTDLIGVARCPVLVVPPGAASGRAGVPVSAGVPAFSGRPARGDGSRLR
ncbi:MAG TPA: universal stress protein [Gaiellaceae bacterium]